jgi:hypothetical protein
MGGEYSEKSHSNNLLIAFRTSTYEPATLLTISSCSCCRSKPISPTTVPIASLITVPGTYSMTTVFGRNICRLLSFISAAMTKIGEIHQLSALSLVPANIL